MYAKRLGLSQVLCLCEGEKRAGSCHFRNLNQPVDHEQIQRKIRIPNPMELYRPKGQVLLTLGKKLKYSLFAEEPLTYLRYKKINRTFSCLSFYPPHQNAKESLPL